MCWSRSYISRKANFKMSWAPKIFNISTWCSPDWCTWIGWFQVVTLSPYRCLWPASASAASASAVWKGYPASAWRLFPQARHVSTFNKISRSEIPTEQFLVRLGNEGGKLVMDEGDIVKQPEQYRCCCKQEIDFIDQFDHVMFIISMFSFDRIILIN